MRLLSFLLGVLVTVENNFVAFSQESFMDYRITDYGQFQCTDKGFRCGYLKEDYGYYEMTSGSQDAVGSLGGGGNNVWSNVGSVSDTLTLFNCSVGYCFVCCFFGCFCVLFVGVLFFFFCFVFFSL